MIPGIVAGLAAAIDLAFYRFTNVTTSPSVSISDSGALARRDYDPTGAGSYKQAWCSAPLAGNVYWEMEVVLREEPQFSIGIGLATDVTDGVAFANSPWSGVVFAGGCGLSSGYYGSGTFSAGGAYAITLSDRVGFAYKSSTRQLWVRKNGTWIDGDPVAGTGETAVLPSNTYVPTASFYTCGGANAAMGARIYVQDSEFDDAPPTGFISYSGV